ncbi:uncharacterized protein LOC106646220 [Copidosoma floridanum]|uniref:uncharacterized protein LOC106646220 n=1 Tax=Copidosoma floridanum TaxID=29053 RepID=UPI000C6F822F|nr:uncharacterized protein LOC106646220 [Copidosoma floridanum]
MARGTYFNSTAHALKVYGHSYYNPMTGEALEGHIDDERLPSGTPKIGFKGLPCTCVDQSCGCCAGLNITAIDFDRRYCVNFTLDPIQFEIDMQVLMNENEIYQTSLSARNPPPVCVPLPYVPVLNFCLRFYDLSLNNSNLNACMDFETRLAQSPLLVMHFNCVRVGGSGIAWAKPGDYLLNNSSTQQTTDGFDHVDFDADDGPTVISSDFTTLAPEDEDKIGQHRIP